jgi:hypothetical protein
MKGHTVRGARSRRVILGLVVLAVAACSSSHEPAPVPSSASSASAHRGADWEPVWTGFFDVYGNMVTGGGTSSVTCPGGLLSTGPAYQNLS